MEWPESRQLAALYQSPGPAGIGFAQYASTGTVTPALWANINTTEARGMYSEPGTEEWTADMKRLRELLKAEGIEPPVSAEDRANRAAYALQKHYGEAHPPPGSQTYGPEGFREAVVELLLDLKFLLVRDGDYRLMLDELTEEATDRWAAIEDGEEDDD
jgi:hypothetical protein